MFYKYFFLIIFALVNTQNFYSQYTDFINSNRPGESFGAFSVGKTIFQTEGGISYIYENHDKTTTRINGIFTDLDIRYGFFREELEFIADLQYQIDKYKIDSTSSTNRNAFKTSQFGFKYLVYDPFKNYTQETNIYSWNVKEKLKWRDLIPAIALYAGANINFTKDNPYMFVNEENISAKVMVSLQHHFIKGWVSVINFSLDKIGTDYMTYSGILTVTKSFYGRWSGFAEIQGYKNDYINDYIARIGSAYLFHKNLQFDVSIGGSINNNRDLIYGGIGASWRFTANYKDLTIYKKTKASKKSNNKGKKEKKEKKEKMSTEEKDDNN